MIIKQQQAYQIIIGTAVASLLLLYYFFDARLASFPQCPFYAITHLYCPGCGSQRALSALLHGHLLAAIRYNLLLTAFLHFLVYIAFIRFWRRQSRPLMLLYHPTFVWVIFTVVMLFWVLRNIPFTPFTLLAPQA